MNNPRFWIFNRAVFDADIEDFRHVGMEQSLDGLSLTFRQSPSEMSSRVRKLYRFTKKASAGDVLALCKTHRILERVGLIQEVGGASRMNRSQIVVKWLGKDISPEVSRRPILPLGEAIVSRGPKSIPDPILKVFRDVSRYDTQVKRLFDLIQIEPERQDYLRFKKPDDRKADAPISFRSKDRPAIDRAEIGFLSLPPKPGLPARFRRDGGVVELAYGTCRTSTNSSRYRKMYSSDLGTGRRGICWVNIPPTHARGAIERPKWWKLRFKEKAEKDVMIVGMEELSIESFKSELRKRVDQGKKEALVFVHGYNTSFEEAALRTAQLVYDLSFKGLGAFYSWPSAGVVKGYLHDLQQVTNSVVDFRQFLVELLSAPGLEKLHVIAHSLGSQLLIRGIADLLRYDSTGLENRPLRQIILAAPDVDQTEFDTLYYQDFIQAGMRRTIYVNEHDFAIDMSETGRGGLLRLGEGGDDIYVRHSIDTVDASMISEGFLVHGYFAKDRNLINDLYMITRHEHSPSQRNLTELEHGSGISYWEFPP